MSATVKVSVVQSNDREAGIRSAVELLGSNQLTDILWLCRVKGLTPGDSRLYRLLPTRPSTSA